MTMETGKRWKVLVVGQTPPPLHGQAVMIRTMLEGKNWEHADLVHLRLDLSSKSEEIGKFGWGKVWRLWRLVVMTWVFRWRHGAEVLYYPPAGRGYWALLRDVIYLISVRFLFSRTVYHFHAAGFLATVQSMPRVARWFVLRAYGSPDVVIRVAEGAPDVSSLLEARQHWVVRNGVDVPTRMDSGRRRLSKEVPEIIFLGRLCKSKGVDDLLEACSRLKAGSYRLLLAGDWDSSEYESVVKEKIERLGLREDVELVGSLEGGGKWDRFLRASIFCLPSFYPDEVLPVAIIEAMACGLPVVASRWGCIPELVSDGETGFLIQPHDEIALAEALQKLLDDEELRIGLGEEGKRRYVEGLTADAYRAGLDRVFASL